MEYSINFQYETGWPNDLAVLAWVKAPVTFDGMGLNPSTVNLQFSMYTYSNYTSIS